MTTPKKVSESHAAEGVSFDLTTPGAVPLAALSPQPATVQEAIEQTYTPQATQSVAGKAELATNAEALAGSDDARIMTPAKVQHKLNNWSPWVFDSDFTKIPKTIYGGQGTVAYMIATFDTNISPNLPKGSIIVFDEQYQYRQGYGNGSYLVTAYRRRSISKTEANDWQFTNEA